MSAAVAETPKPAKPQQISLALQFRTRTLQAEFQRVRAEIAELRLKQQFLAAEIAKAEAEIKSVCGGEYSLNPDTGEFVCKVPTTSK